jgi:uncharacterized protein YgbK (DUF1537 family)
MDPANGLQGRKARKSEGAPVRCAHGLINERRNDRINKKGEASLLFTIPSMLPMVGTVLMIAVISDDLTGAAELGAVGLRYGLAAEIVAGEGEIGAADLVCVDTNSRSASREEAARRTAAAARQLKAAGAQWVYKKVDSVLRGHVVAEVEAVMKEFGFDRALIVPANPLLGRIVRDGRYYVRGKPIHETEFASDPEHPRKTSSVVDLLEGAQSFSVTVSPLPGTLAPKSIVLGEAASPTDLQRWAARQESDTLAAGGAEYFAAILAAKGHKAARGVSNGAPASEVVPELFICGSASASTCDFAAEAKKRGTPVFSLPANLGETEKVSPESLRAQAEEVAAALRNRHRVIINIGVPVTPGKTKAASLLARLGELAECILRRGEVVHVYAEGGSTAAELVSRMRWKRLKVLREEARGVVTLAPEGEKPLLLTMKPGSYIWPGTIKGTP